MLNFENLFLALILAFAFSFVLAVLFAPMVLAWYRRVLLRGMSSWQAGAKDFQNEPSPKSHPPRPLSFQSYQAGNLVSYPFDKSGNRRLTLIYTLGALVFGVVVAFGFFDFRLETEGIEVTPIRIFIFTTVYALPGAFIAFQRLTGRVWSFFGGGAALIVLLYIMLRLRGNDELVFTNFVALYLVALVPIVMFSLLTLRNQRTVTPYIFLILLGIVPAYFFWLNINYAVVMSIQDSGGDGAWFPLFKWLTIFLFILLYVGGTWLLFRWLSRRYERKRFSVWMMEADTMMAISAIFFASVFATVGKVRGVVGVLLAFILYKITVQLLSAIFIQKKSGEPHSLLFLRVFGRREHVRRLMQPFTFHWQFLGPVNLITAPDLAGEYLEPHEMLDLLTFRTKNRFVKTQADLEHQFSQLDMRLDPDGRFRVNEFFCYNNMWKQVLHALLPHSRAVMMDLRGFTKKNEGCLYEIAQLVNHVPLGKVLFLIDAHTDIAFLKNQLSNIWANLNTDSVNQDSDGSIQFFQVKKADRKEIDLLKGLVFQMTVK